MRVLAALSGGVDSAVAAARALDAGHDVVGVHMALSRNRDEFRSGSRGCCSIEDSNDARRAADRVRELGQRVAVAGDEHDVVAGGRELPRELLAQPAARSGDECGRHGHSVRGVPRGRGRYAWALGARGAGG